MIIFLLILLILISLILIGIIKIKLYLKNTFNVNSLKELISKTELEEETREKTLYGMESIYKPILEKDFNNLNINELKSIAEKSIIECYKFINERSTDKFNCESENVISWVNNKINSLNDNDTYSDIKIHRTVLNKYEKNNSVATITFQTSYEYKFNNKKIQSRMQTEFIYIIDADQVDGNVIGLNCPNCGAPIKNLGNKNCDFCGTGVVDIVKRTWFLNNMKEI